MTGADRARRRGDDHGTADAGLRRARGERRRRRRPPWPRRWPPSRRCRASGCAASRGCTPPSRSGSSTSPSSGTRSSPSTCRPGPIRRPARSRSSIALKAHRGRVRAAGARALGAARARSRPARVRPGPAGHRPAAAGPIARRADRPGEGGPAARACPIREARGAPVRAGPARPTWPRASSRRAGARRCATARRPTRAIAEGDRTAARARSPRWDRRRARAGADLGDR